VWLHVHRVSCDDGRLNPAQDRDLLREETSVLCTWSCQPILSYLALAFHVEGFEPFHVVSRLQVSKSCVKISRTSLVNMDFGRQR